jgi:hypothetical protein
MTREHQKRSEVNIFIVWILHAILRLSVQEKLPASCPPLKSTEGRRALRMTFIVFGSAFAYKERKAVWGDGLKILLTIRRLKDELYSTFGC